MYSRRVTRPREYFCVSKCLASRDCVSTVLDHTRRKKKMYAEKNDVGQRFDRRDTLPLPQFRLLHPGLTAAQWSPRLPGYLNPNEH
jgi:hypothetical protein